MGNLPALVSDGDERGGHGGSTDKHEDALDDPELMVHLGARPSRGTALLPTTWEGDVESEHDADGVLGTDLHIGATVEGGVEVELNEELWRALDLSKSAMGTASHPEDERVTLQEVLGDAADRKSVV